MNTNQNGGLLLKDEVFNVIGAAMEVSNGLGHRLNEKPYENALIVEFNLRRIPCQQQPSYEVIYKGHKVRLFIPDLIAYAAIVVDAKVIERITDAERGQMLNYLKITKLRVGVILNFKNPRLEWERIVL